MVSIDKLENILNTNLIYSKKSLEKAELISKSADIDSFIFELCKDVYKRQVWDSQNDF